jgi:LacI family gluconate utilization system Gnt-I transcriptional repressor
MTAQSSKNRPVGEIEPGKKVNLDDIARAVGVSPITVSRALRSPDKVSAATRAKIQAAVEDLGYVPNLLASSLASKRSQVVAIILPTLTNAIFADSIQGVSDALREQGYQLIIGDSDYSGERETSLVATLLGRRPDGLILVGSVHSGQVIRQLSNAAIPVVEIWELPQNPIDSVVGFSNYAAMYAMTEYMIRRGYRRIAFISTRNNQRAAARLNGYRACLRAHGHDYRLQAFPLASEDITTDPAIEFSKLIGNHPDIDAICCADDITAFNVLFVCQRNGWPVPGRIAVSGFCDLQMARRIQPPLTTVRVPAYAIGREAARLIIGRIDGSVSGPITLDLGFEIIKRETA